MESKLAAAFRKARLGMGLNLGEAARLVGYKNVSKGVNRISSFECGGEAQMDLVITLAGVLGIDLPTVNRLIEEDRQQFLAEWNVWADKPMRPYLIVSDVATVSGANDVSESLESVQPPEAYVASVDGETHAPYCLVMCETLAKEMKQIGSFGDGGNNRAGMAATLADVLDIARATAERLIEDDHQHFLAEWNAWANGSVRPYRRFRCMAKIYRVQNLPGNIHSAEEAESHAVGVAGKRHLRCCLILSRRISIWLAADGMVEGVFEAVPGNLNAPHTKVDKEKCLLKIIDRGMAFQQVHWPRQGMP